MSSESKPNVYVSERFQNPEAFQNVQRKENFVWAGVLAILASLCFVALLALQWMEYSAVKVA